MIVDLQIIKQQQLINRHAVTAIPALKIGTIVRFLSPSPAADEEIFD
jgi:hypothetical protein